MLGQNIVEVKGEKGYFGIQFIKVHSQLAPRQSGMREACGGRETAQGMVTGSEDEGRRRAIDHPGHTPINLPPWARLHLPTSHVAINLLVD